ELDVLVHLQHIDQAPIVPHSLVVRDRDEDERWLAAISDHDCPLSRLTLGRTQVLIEFTCAHRRHHNHLKCRYVTTLLPASTPDKPSPCSSSLGLEQQPPTKDTDPLVKGVKLSFMAPHRQVDSIGRRVLRP